MRAMRLALAAVVIAGLSALLPSGLSTTAWATEADEDAAQAAAESWLKLVDAGAYSEAWQRAATIFKAAVPREEWKKAFGIARGRVGALVSRRIVNRDYADRVTGAPDGKYVILRFRAVFRNKASVIETVTCMVDEDDTWRVAAYTIA